MHYARVVVRRDDDNGIDSLKSLLEDKTDGGWYIFCNGRMVVRADQSQLTGWGDSDGKRMPKYHPDFAFFRGYVFFDCQNAALLPWTTTKQV